MKKVLLGVALAMGLAFGVLPEDVKECFIKGVSCPGGKTLYMNYVLPTDISQLTEMVALDCEKDNTGEVCVKTANRTNGDAAKQVLYLERACDLNYAPGCRALGFVYAKEHFYGNNLFAFPKHALGAFKKACDLNDGNGCQGAAAVYKNFFGTTPKELIDYKKAIEFTKKGCDLNDRYACYDLGYAYEHGEGVKVDKAQAKKFFQKSCKLGDKDGCSAFKKIIKGGK